MENQINMNIGHNSYGYNRELKFKPLSKQFDVKYIKGENNAPNISVNDSFFNQNMLNPQMDLDVPENKCIRQ